MQPVEKHTITEIIEQNLYCPIPIQIFPNNMGINLCCVDAIAWQKTDDGQLANVSIWFLPSIDD